MGIDGIYKVDMNDTLNPIVTEWLHINTLAGVDVGSNPRTVALPANLNVSNNDAAVFSKVGILGIGDIDLSDDESKLYVLNLNNHGQLLTIDVENKSLDNAIDIPVSVCTDSNDIRPWGLKSHHSYVYVGVVCSGESGGAGALEFTVLKYDGVTFTTVMNESLGYTKGRVHNSYSTPANWETWTTLWSGIHDMGTSGAGKRKSRPQPILSDLEFDAKGNLILGFLDRAGLQLGYKNRATSGTSANNNGYIGGDVLKAEYDFATDSFILESAGQTSNGEGCGANNQGPSGGEFFCGDKYSSYHSETSLGALVVLIGLIVVQVHPHEHISCIKQQIAILEQWGKLLAWAILSYYVIHLLLRLVIVSG